MLTARSVITVVVLLVIVSILAAMWSAIQPLDQGGMGADSYGTRAPGTKAVFYLLGDLGIPVERALVPFGEWVNRATTYVVWAPDTELLSVEPVYLQRLADWVREGGRLVVAPESRDARGVWPPRTPSGETLTHRTTVLKELGLREIDTHMIDAAGEDAPPEKIADETDSDETKRDDDANDHFSDLTKAWREHFHVRSGTSQQVSVRSEGDLQPLAASIDRLELPRRLQVLELHESKPSGRVTAKINGQERVLAASFHVGQGDIIVVGDSVVFENRLISRADNPVFAVHILDAPGRPVVWDEFYHGLTVRGNAWYLLTRGRYAILALLVAATTGFWVWRQAMFLGPPLAPAAVGRRSIAEYVEAMARLFQRSRASDQFVLGVVSDGVLWWQRHKLTLRPGQETLEEVTTALARRDPVAAQQLLDAVTSANITLSRGSRLSHGETLRALRKLADCVRFDLRASSAPKAFRRHS